MELIVKNNAVASVKPKPKALGLNHDFLSSSLTFLERIYVEWGVFCSWGLWEVNRLIEGLWRIRKAAQLSA
jgi:hypothetical protein